MARHRTCETVGWILSGGGGDGTLAQQGIQDRTERVTKYTMQNFDHSWTRGMCPVYYVF